MRADRFVSVAALAALGCREAPAAALIAQPAPSHGATPPSVSIVPGGMADARPANHFAYVPVQCYAKVERSGGARNPCYTCHQRSRPPNYVNDEALQLSYDVPAAGANNPWQNALSRPVERAAPISDAALLAYVRQSNYLDSEQRIGLRSQLEQLPAEWDGERDGEWNGFVPDAGFDFDTEGFDRFDGSDSGWRAFAYRPLPGAFLPTNGAMGDVLIRLDARLRSDVNGRLSRDIYRINLAIVEALINRRDVAIAETDERQLGVDLNLDGSLGVTSSVAFDRLAESSSGRTRMRYVGAGRDALDPIEFPIAVGLFPLGTEFLHSLRYLDVEGENVHMAARMKELRYARKASWLSYDDLKRAALSEPAERSESRDGSARPIWQFDRGVFNGQGWLYQGFIEAADGRLRPQSHAETAACFGCHGGVGATSDGTFSFARKLPSGTFRGGWFHWSQHALDDAEAGREYSSYLKHAGADDFGTNLEARDASSLFRPSPARALELDRAYLAIVREQSFELGRDALLSSAGVLATVTPGAKTGIAVALAPTR